MHAAQQKREKQFQEQTAKSIEVWLISLPKLVCVWNSFVQEADEKELDKVKERKIAAKKLREGQLQQLEDVKQRTRKERYCLDI